MLRRPLAGKRVVVTRALGQSGDLVHSFELLGAEVFSLPAVEFAPVEDSSKLDGAIRRLSSFDWILFTSQNAVRFFLGRCRELGVQAAAIRKPQPMVAAVGPATARAATSEGLRVDHVAKQHRGEALAQELRRSLKGRKVLLPRSDRADARLPAALVEAGAIVTEVIAYRTLVPNSFDAGLLQRIRKGEIDVILFASPSAFLSLVHWVGEAELKQACHNTRIACIGPRTADAVRHAGLPVTIEAQSSTAQGLAAAVAADFEAEGSGATHP